MKAVLLDTNVLLLFLIGNKHPDRIGFRRLSAFDRSDLRRVNDICLGKRRHFTVPNVLTEVSNLLGSGPQRLVQDGGDLLAKYCRLAEEFYLPSQAVVQDGAFQRLGLTDAAIIRLADNHVTVLTVDHGLHGGLIGKGVDAVNILHGKAQY